MRNARATAPADYFLGVRLTQAELTELDRFGATEGRKSRSDAVRALVARAARAVGPTGPELPVGLASQLDTIVEDGWARDQNEALTLVLTLGLSELARLHSERLPALRRTARESAERRGGRRRADREGRGLLGR